MIKKQLIIWACMFAFIAMGVSANLLANGDFESGTATPDKSATFDAPPWQRHVKPANYNSWLTDGVFDPAVGVGNQALEFRWGVTYVHQEIPISSGASYDFHADVLNAYGAQKWDGHLQVEWRDGSGSKIGETETIGSYASQTDAVGAWVPLSGTRIAPVGAEVARIVMILTNNGSGLAVSSLYFDNVSAVLTGFVAATPVSTNDAYAVVENGVLNIAAPGVLANDSDPEDDPLTAQWVSDPSNGSLTLNADGSFSYAPNPGFVGTDDFNYRANDGSWDGNVATVSIAVTMEPPALVAPVANADAYSVVRGDELRVAEPGVLMNDEDANGDALSAILVTDVAHGALSLNANGSFDYVPAVGHTGIVSFSYALMDGVSTGNTATVTIQVFEPIAVERPNILIFFADDMGRGDSRVYNTSTNRPPAQPTIEAFAAAGMVFNDAHTQASLCAPSRYCILTGNYPWRGRLEGGSWHMNKGAQVMPGQNTLAHVLNSAGYETAIFGKGHLGGYLVDTNGVADTKQIVWKSAHAAAYLEGDLSQQDDYYDPRATDWSLPVSNGVSSALVGFDYSYMLYGGIQDPLYSYFENDFIVDDPSALELWNNPTFETPNGLHNTYRPGYGYPGWHTCDVGPTLTRRTLDYIDAHVATNQANGTDTPFFIHYCAEAVHSKHTPPIDFLGTPVAGTTGYAHSDMLFELEVAFSNMLIKLEDKGLLDDTLIIFTSDNGGLGLTEAKSGHNPNEGLRGYKAGIWEGGHSVPMFIKWGDKIPPGSYGHMVGVHDLYATIAELVGKQQGAGQGLDAVSLLSVLTRGDVAPVRDTMLHARADDQGDPGFVKVGTPPRGKGRALREGSYKLVWDDLLGAPVYLYNLEADPLETTNLINDQGQAQRVARMTGMMSEFVALTSDQNRYFGERSESLPPLRDLNENGMDDDWEVDYFGSTNAVNGEALGDYESDGINNLLEFAFGSDPTVIDDPAAVFPMFGTSGDTFEYVYRRRQDAAARNMQYLPEQTENLVSNAWNPAGLVEVGSGFVNAEIETVTNHFPMVGSSINFFRLQIEAQ